MLHALRDPDGGVRDLAVESIPDGWEVPVAIRCRLKQMVKEGPTRWCCRWCGTDNQVGEARGCSKCHTVGPEPAIHARKRLKGP